MLTFKSGWSFNKARSLLLSVTYVATRISEAAIGHQFSGGTLKQQIQMGYITGLNGEIGCIALKRLGEMLEPEPALAGNQRLEDLVQSVVGDFQDSSEDAIEQFLGRVSAFYRQMAESLRAAEPQLASPADSPTAIALLQFAELADRVVANAGAASNREFDCDAMIAESEFDLDLAQTPVAELPDEPYKPAFLEQNDELPFAIKSLAGFKRDNWKQLKGFLHFVCVDIEYTASQVCGFFTLKFRDMPFEFKFDMARQVFDEARHAILLEERLNSMGVNIGDYTYCHRVWKHTANFETLAEMLAVQQVLQEGNALDDSIVLQRYLRDSGQVKTAEMFDYVNADEAVHVRLGNKWITKLMNGDAEKVAELMDRVAETAGIRNKDKTALPEKLFVSAGFDLWLKHGTSAA